MSSFLLLVMVLLSLTLFVCGTDGSADATLSFSIDILFINGRVIDPETHFDSVTNVGVADGKIVYIDSKIPDNNNDMNTSIHRIIDITGLVLCPGFIDIHAHHQTKEGNEYQARDGVTTSLELEIGTFPITKWYVARKETGSLLNYGASVGHIPIRLYMAGFENIQLFINTWQLPSGEWNNKVIFNQNNHNTPEMERLLNYFRQGLNEGGLGIGLGIEYVKHGANEQEIYAIFELIRNGTGVIFVHVRETNELKSFQEVILNAIVLNTSVHIMHIGSSARDYVPLILDIIDQANQNIMQSQNSNDDGNTIPRITTEVYPYTAGSTLIKSNVFLPGWQERLGITFGDLQYVKTGEMLTEQTFHEYRENAGGLLIIQSMKEEFVSMAVRKPSVIIASDGIPFIEGKYGHPRGSGTFSRVLSKYVRQEQQLSLMAAIRKMSYLPASLLSQLSDDFAKKGKIQVGMDADITVFDARKVNDMGTYTRGAMASEGVLYVAVNGVLVVDQQTVVRFADHTLLPGKAMYSNLYYENLKSQLKKQEL